MMIEQKLKPEGSTSVSVAEKKAQEEPKDNNPFQLYTYTMNDFVCDLIYKTTVATVLFFMSYPWAALFWPPYYFTKRQK